MAIAKALPGLYDLGNSVTPSDLSNLLHHVVDAVNNEPLLISRQFFFSSFGFSFQSVAFNVKFLFLPFSLVADRSFGFTKQNDCQLWRFSAVSIAALVLRSIASIAVYNLFMHLSLGNQDSLWRISSRYKSQRLFTFAFWPL